MRLGRQWNGLGGGEGTDTARGLIFQSEPQIYKKLEVVYIIIYILLYIHIYLYVLLHSNA